MGGLRNICIFGCGKSGRSLYDSIKRVNDSINCIFCDNDPSKYSDLIVEIVSPEIVAQRIKAREIDAVIIPGVYYIDYQIAMMTQLALLGVGADVVFVAEKDFMRDRGFDICGLKRMADICLNELVGDTVIYPVNNMRELFPLLPRIQVKIDKLTDRYGIDGKRRIMVFNCALLIAHNNGDIWYFLSRVPVYESIYDCKLVILLDKDNADAVYIKSRFLEYDGYKFEFLPIDDSEITVLTRGSSNLSLYIDIIFSCFDTDRFRIFGPSKTSSFALFFKNTYAANLDKKVRRPHFPNFNKQYYIDTYGVVPGRTFWIIPDSNFVKPFPLSYWNAIAAILRNIGYAVCFNSKDSACNGTLAFIPWEDVVGFAELCGYVIGTRTGFFDFAIIARANFIIYTPPRYLDSCVENAFDVDNSDGHIRAIPIQGTKNFTNLPELKYFAKIRRNFVEYIHNLSCEKDRYVIFIASKDAHCPPPGADANKHLRVLSLLGLEFNFSVSYRWSYCTVIDGGNVIAEKSSSEECAEFVYSFDNGRHKAEVISEGFNVSKERCYASVIIDGFQTCMNRRGLNIIVWDKNKGKVEESVVFDTFNIPSMFDTDHLRSIALGRTNLN